MKTIQSGRFTSYLLRSYVHGEVEVQHTNLQTHILRKHTEMSLELIEFIILDPDGVYKCSKNSKDHYYEREFEGKIYRVVVGRNAKNTKKKMIITAYEASNHKWYSPKLSLCIYERGDFEIEFDEEDFKNEYLKQLKGELVV